MGKRKTFKVEDFKNSVNFCLRYGLESPDHRQALITALDSILHSTGNYYGFHYLNQRDVPENHKPGLWYDFTAMIPIPMLDYQERFAHTDPTRVQYY